MLDAYPLRSKRRAGLLDRLSQTLSVLSQANSAAHLYAELSRKCDAALAEQGLRRSDVPRLAYHELTKEP
jgi:hypothetical protein